jgi:hypothetical protein
MQYLASFLVVVFGKIFDFFATYITKKIALLGAVVTTSVALMTAFWVALKALIFGLMHQVTNQTILMGFYAIWPSNAELCISTYWTAQLVAYIYREHRENLRAFLYVG